MGALSPNPQIDQGPMTQPKHPIKSPEDIVIRFLEEIGEDPKRDGLIDTPSRVVRSWKELFAGYQQDPKEILSTRFSTGPEIDPHTPMMHFAESQSIGPIEFHSTCEHHLLPFMGVAYIGYVPRTKSVVGISKLARLVDCFAKRLQIQEVMTGQIHDAITEYLPTNGAAVVLEAKHFCMACRGIGKQLSVMTTSKYSGNYACEGPWRNDFMCMMERRGRG